MNSNLRKIGFVGLAVLFLTLGMVLAQGQASPDAIDDGVWVLTQKNYNSSFIPNGNVPDDGFEDIIDQQDIELHEDCVLYSVETSHEGQDKEIAETVFSEYYWNEPPRVIRPGDEIELGVTCSSICWYKPENKDYFDGCYCPSIRIYYGDCNTIWDELGMAVTFPDGPILTCSAKATNDDYEEGKAVTNSVDEIWLVPEHDPGDCDTDLDKLTLKIMFMDRDLWGLVYYYNYTWQPGEASSAIKPEDNGDLNTEKDSSACDRLKVYLKEANSGSDTCLLSTRVVEICSDDEQGLSDALLQFRIWDTEGGDYRELERSTDNKGECILEVPKGTQRVDVYASKDGYDEDWTNIHYCCGQGSETRISPEIERSGQEAAQPDRDIDISGRWNSSIGFVYDIQQSGNSFTWQTVSPISEEGQGTFTDKDKIKAEWNGDNGSGSSSGTIEYSGNKIIRILWNNGVVFTRE